MTLIELAALAVLAVIGVGAWLFISRCREQERQLAEHLKEFELKEKAAITAHLKEKVARKAAERALELKHLLIDNVSQELMTTVNAIAGFSEMLALSGDDGEGRYLAGHVLKNSQRLTDMLGRIVELSHYEILGSVDLRGNVLVNFTCHQLLEGYRKEVAEGVELLFETGLPDDYVIHTNEECLEKALRYLVGNAVRHTRSGMVTLSVTDDGKRDTLTFSVTDTGTGIPEKYQRMVFEILPDTGYDLKLTGLSLMVTRVLARLLGGVIYIDPHYQEGTRVVLGINL